MSLKDAARFLLQRLPSGLLVAAALLGFVVLSRGTGAGRGTITAYAEAQVHSVAALQPGRIASVPVHLGQRVRAGDVLAVLDRRTLELQRDRLVAQFAQAQAQLEAERDVEGAALQRGQLQAVRSHAAEESARAELHELEQQLERLKPLLEQHLIRAHEIEEVRQRRETVAAELAARSLGSAREKQLLGLRPRTTAEQGQRLQQRLAPYEATVRVQQAALREVEHALTEMTLRAPVDGAVGEILHRPGDVVTAAVVVVTVVRARPGYVVAYVPERQVRGLDVGTGVVLRRLGQLGGALRGRVVEIAPLVDEVPVRARVSPTVPLWARRVAVHIDDNAALVPGEAFHVTVD